MIENKTTHEDVYKINQMLKDELKKKPLIIFSKKPQNKNEIKTNKRKIKTKKVQKKAQVHESIDHAHFLEKNIICNTSPTEKSRQGCFTPENSFLNHFLTKKNQRDLNILVYAFK